MLYLSFSSFPKMFSHNLLKCSLYLFFISIKGLQNYDMLYVKEII